MVIAKIDRINFLTATAPSLSYFIKPRLIQLVCVIVLFDYTSENLGHE